jgi:hypothetical protein
MAKAIIRAAFQEFDSGASLHEHLSKSGGRSLLAGPDPEAPRKCYSPDITEVNGRETRIGILLSHFGIRPSWTFSVDGNYLASGYDRNVSFIDVAQNRRLATRELEGVFLSLSRDQRATT